MFLPIGDAPNPKGLALANSLLIAANVAVFLLVNVPLGARRADPRDPAFREFVEVMAESAGDRVSRAEIARSASAYDLFAFTHGFRPAAPQLPDLVSCMFLHSGLLHLAGNMLFLWIYGDNVERRLGSVAYVCWYLACGVAATLFHALFFRASPIPLVGASGAISGVLGFYFLWFPRNVVRVLWFLPPFLMQVFEVPARVVLGLYLLADNLLPFLLAGGGSVAHGAHIGGFLAGAVVAWVMGSREAAAPPLRDAPAAPPPDGVRAALAQGRLEQAAAAYFALPEAATRRLLSPEEAVALAGFLRRAGHPDAALLVLRREARDVPAGPGLAEVYALAGLILLQDRREPTSAYQYLLTALDLGPSPATAEAVRRALAEIDALQKRQIGRLRRPHAW